MADKGSQFARTATDEECKNPLKTLDSRGWLPKTVAGKNVLCLAAGGGWQSILYAVAGANVTVVDISPSMLRLDAREAERRGLNIRIHEASMDDLSILEDASFHLVHQPVSTCYVPSIRAVYREVARVLRPGGLYVSQHKQPTSAQITQRTRANKFILGIEYYHEGALPEVPDTSYREQGTREYLHRWEDLVGGLCQSGLVLLDLTEPSRADKNAAVTHFGYRGRFVAPYVRLLARRETCQSDEEDSAIWIPS